jgi:hypothetical protein
LSDEEDGSESSRESGEESSESEAAPPAAKKQRLLQSAPSGRDCAINICIYRVFTLYGAGKTKYSMEDVNRNISEILGESTPHLGLVKAAYTEASWKKINSALNAYKNFCLCKKLPFKLPIDHSTMSDFISWAALEKKLSPDSIKSYISNIKLIHKLKGLPTDGCSS